MESGIYHWIGDEWVLVTDWFDADGAIERGSVDIRWASVEEITR